MKKFLRILTNKFVLTGLGFLLWMAYFDQNDWQSISKKSRDLEEIDNNISYLNREIARMEKEHYQMTSEPQKLEQYAREQYKMKRDNEDLYIIEAK
ncbi:MAG: septum formation initiator [Sphingobacteriales bacterium]|nr:MAG: septum formation initiator [Sphingobacteriales bacterium]